MGDGVRRWLALALLVGLATWAAVELASAPRPGAADRAATGDDAASIDAVAPPAARAPEPARPAPLEPPPAHGAPRAPPAPVAPRLELAVVRGPDDAPVPGARVHVLPRGAGAPHELVASERGRVGWTPPAEQQAWSLLARVDGAEGAAEARLELTRADLGALHLLRLRPTEGWTGRVEDPLGTPLAAEVTAWRWWPPRPALLDDGHPDGPRLLSHQRRAALEPLRAGADGRFVVPRLPGDELSELVLAVRGAGRGSAPLHVPLPPPDGELPPLVVHAQDALLVQLLGADGRALPGVELELDDGPGSRREGERRAASDADGLLRVPRHLGGLALRTADAGWALLAARADARPLRPDDAGWLAVPPGTARVVLELARPRVLRGRLRDELDGRAVIDAVARAELLDDDGTWREVAAAPADAGGGFELRAPLEAEQRLLRVRVEAAAYEPWQRELLAGASDALGEVRLRPRATSGLLRGRVTAGEERPVVGAVVQLWTAPPEERGAVFPHEPLPEDYTPLATLRTAPGGRFETRLDGAAGHQLVVVAEQTDERGLLVRAVLGPLLRDAWLDAGELRLELEREPPALLPVIVDGWPVGRAGVLESSHWYPLDGTTLTLRDAFAGPRHPGERLRFEVPVPRGGETLVELRLQRRPVDAPLVGAARWIEVPLRGDPEPLRLEAPPRGSVSGVVRGLDPEQRARAAVALLGAPVAEWRAESLGESDRAVRPDAAGRWRFDDVPEGAANLVLYLSGEHEGVEILSQAPIFVRGDLSGLALLPETAGAEPALEGRPLR